MANYSEQISTALDGILSSLNNIETQIKPTGDTVNIKQQDLINNIQTKLDTIMYKNNFTNEGNDTKVIGRYGVDPNYVPVTKVKTGNIENIVPFKNQVTDDNQVIDERTSFSELDPNQSGGRRKRNRSSKNKRKSAEEQPEKKTEQEEKHESPKPQKKSFFSRFNPFKTKGGRRSRKHRTTKKGGRRHK
jgi:hypothetical protein